MTDTAHTTDDHANDHSSGGHGKARYDDIPISNVLYFGAISVVVTLLSFLFVKGLLNAFTSHYETFRQGQVVETAANQEIAAQKKVLATGGTISIEEASKKVLEKYGSQKESAH